MNKRPMTEHVAGMAECVAVLAAERGLFISEPLASPSEVLRHRCPVHGLERCTDHGLVMRWGCIERQLEALRTDRPEPQPATVTAQLAAFQADVLACRGEPGLYLAGVHAALAIVAREHPALAPLISEQMRQWNAVLSSNLEPTTHWSISR